MHRGWCLFLSFRPEMCGVDLPTQARQMAVRVLQYLASLGPRHAIELLSCQKPSKANHLGRRLGLVPLTSAPLMALDFESPTMPSWRCQKRSKWHKRALQPLGVSLSAEKCFRTGPGSRYSRPVGGSKIPHILSQDSIQILSDAIPVDPMTGLARDFPARPRLSGTPQVFGSQLLTLLGVYAWMAQGWTRLHGMTERPRKRRAMNKTNTWTGSFTHRPM